MIKLTRAYLIVLLLMTCFNYYFIFGLTIVGYHKENDGLGKLPSMIINTLEDNTKINFVNTRPEFQPIPNINILPNCSEAENITIFTDALYYPPNFKPYKLLPKNNSIKFAYSMFESNIISNKWTKVLNKYFDGVIVPDDFLVKVYKDSGVKIPIFVLPMAIDLDPYIKNSKVYRPKMFYSSPKKFWFGSTGCISNRKNFMKLIFAFGQTFGQNNEVGLIVHGKSGNKNYIREIKQQVSKYQNIFLVEKSFTQNEYIKFLKNLDCYALISKGEGYSLTPREAMALGLPCILSNNTAHITLCNSKLVYGVPAKKHVRAYYSPFNSYVGYNYDCSIRDIKIALENVYYNYEPWIKRAKLSKEWVKRYSFDSLKYFYRSLVKPKNIILGDVNIIKDNCIITTSIELYKKYKNLI